MIYTMRNKLVLPTTELFEELKIFELINMVFLVWYGVFWTQPEDIGYAIGIILKMIFGVDLEQFSQSDADWECPHKSYFESRETYDDW